jgi:hypothetical protein
MIVLFLLVAGLTIGNLRRALVARAVCRETYDDLAVLTLAQATQEAARHVITIGGWAYGNLATCWRADLGIALHGIRQHDDDGRDGCIGERVGLG